MATSTVDPRAVERMTMDYPVRLLSGPTSTKTVSGPTGMPRPVRRRSAAEAFRLAEAFDREQLHHYWTRGEGLEKWAKSDHPWTELYHHLLKYMDEERAKLAASAWFEDVFHFTAGSDLNRVTHGKPPRGHVVGPG